MAGVINETYGIKSKMERIQIIAKAAENHSGLTGLKWEQINEELKIQSSQEATCIE